MESFAKIAGGDKMESRVKVAIKMVARIFSF